jgi:hypothetical protein
MTEKVTKNGFILCYASDYLKDMSELVKKAV